jgi:hypothetical protein
MSTYPGGAKKERKPQKHAYVCPRGTKKEKKEEKRRKNPWKHAYACCYDFEQCAILSLYSCLVLSKI